MAQERPGPSAQAHPGMAAALEHLRPYVAAVGAVAVLGTPAELAVPLVRRLRRESGVAVGPGLVNLVNGLVALAVTHSVRTHPGRVRHTAGKRTRVGGLIAGAVYLAGSPAAAARWRGGVVLRDRSPLWGALCSPVGLLQLALVLGAIARAGRAAPDGTGVAVARPPAPAGP